MKKLIPFLLIFALLCGCGAGKKEQKTENAAPAATPSASDRAETEKQENPLDEPEKVTVVFPDDEFDDDENGLTEQQSITNASPTEDAEAAAASGTGVPSVPAPAQPDASQNGDLSAVFDGADGDGSIELPEDEF